MDLAEIKENFRLEGRSVSNIPLYFDDAVAWLIAAVESLTAEKEAAETRFNELLSAKQVTILPPAMPESELVKHLQANNVELRSEVYRISSSLAQAREEMALVHRVLDDDPSKIVRNGKDGYPEGRPDRILTLTERVKSLCDYAADWKRWNEAAAQREKGLREHRDSVLVADKWKYGEINRLEDALKAAEQRKKGLMEDAERWRAIIGCARVRTLGSAGIVIPNEQGYAHIGVELWTHHTASSEPEAIEWLTKFADISKAALAAASKEEA